VATQRLHAGERIGYGFSYEAVGEMVVGVVACGYADGYPRHAPSGTPVLVNGRRTRTVGRVSMDMICVDITGIPGAGIGSAVTLWGEGLVADGGSASSTAQSGPGWWPGRWFSSAATPASASPRSSCRPWGR